MIGYVSKYTGTQIDQAVGTVLGCAAVTPQMFRSKDYDGTDDTESFQLALADNRRVYVPGGTYNLSGELIIGDNSELELAQDAVLVFAQTEGNCITLNMLSSLKGNHATIKVPYDFEGNVIYASTSTVLTQADRRDVEPFEQWDPQWKSGRYITDINICKADLCEKSPGIFESRNLHCLVAYDVDGDIQCDECKGTAVYLSADANCPQTFLWGVTCSGIRIAGAFKYGIHAQNFKHDTKTDYVGWNHDMRIEAIMDACETGVSLENCNCAFLDVAIQPRGALISGRNGDTPEDYAPYAKHGIKLINSNNVDLSGSHVWDWNATNTLFGKAPEYKFLSLYGDCSGAIVNALQYYGEVADIRDLIYDDTSDKDNLERITIVQEPIDRWFKNRNGEPYFFDGFAEKKLTTEEEIEAIFSEKSMSPRFTNQLLIATDEDGTTYNGKGYKSGVALQGGDGKTLERDDTRYISTIGFIPVSKGSVIRTKDMRWLKIDDFAERIVFYDNDKNIIKVADGKYTAFVQSGKLEDSKNYIPEFTDTDDGFEMTLGSISEFDNLGYIRISLRTTSIGADPVITVDEEIAYSIVGTLSDKVKVKAENIIGLPEGSGVDVTASVGQTIIVKEVDGNGKPTKWESVDYQPRTHWTEVVEILPETIGEVDDGLVIIPNITLEAGKEYTVNYNGMEYVSKCVIVTSDDGEGCIIGNAPLLMETGDNGQPFVAVYDPASGLVCMPLDEATSVTLSITSIKNTPIPEQYMTNAFPYYIDVTGSGTDDDPFICKETAEQLNQLLSNGRELRIRKTQSYVENTNGGGIREVLHYGLSYSRFSILSTGEYISYSLGFTSFYVPDSTVSFAYKTLFLNINNADGTVTVSTKTSD